jgi:hypothetical protein
MENEVPRLLEDVSFPGLPHPKPSVSFWLQLVRGEDSLINHRTTADLPQTAPCIIIGSGLSGAAIAHHLLSDDAGYNPFNGTLMLEARDVCSGM